MALVAGCERDAVPEPGPEPMAARPRLVEPEPAPVLEKWPAACIETTDFVANGHSGVDGEPEDRVTRRFDAAGRTTIEHWWRFEPHVPDRWNVHSYDADGRLVRETLRVEEPEPGEAAARGVVRITSYRYDAGDWQVAEEIDEDADGEPDWIHERDVDGDGRLLELRENVNAETGKVGLYRWYEYDEDGRLVAERVDNEGDGTPKLDIAYRYDAAGHKVERVRRWRAPGYDPEVTTFEYDDAGRLTRETTRNVSYRWTYDAAGNPLTKERWYDNQEYLGVQTRYRYDCWTAEE